MKIDGNRFRQRRQQVGPTLREVARSAGVSRSTVARIENTGDARQLQVGTFMKLLRALGLDISDLTERASQDSSAVSGLVQQAGALLHKHGRALGWP